MSRKKNVQIHALKKNLIEQQSKNNKENLSLKQVLNIQDHCNVKNVGCFICKGTEDIKSKSMFMNCKQM